MSNIFLKSGTIIKDGDRQIIFVKGASEIVLDGCSHMQGFDGQLLEMTKALKNQIHTAIENMANQALRTIIIAQKQLKSEGSLINFPN